MPSDKGPSGLFSFPAMNEAQKQATRDILSWALPIPHLSRPAKLLRPEEITDREARRFAAMCSTLPPEEQTEILVSAILELGKTARKAQVAASFARDAAEFLEALPKALHAAGVQIEALPDPSQPNQN